VGPQRGWEERERKGRRGREGTPIFQTHHCHCLRQLLKMGSKMGALI